MKKRLDNRLMFYGANAITFSRAEELRNNLTESEQRLWKELSKNKLGVRSKVNILWENGSLIFTAMQ